MPIKMQSVTRAQITSEIDKVIFKSLAENIELNTEDNNRSTNGLDAFLAENTALTYLVNKRIHSDLTKKGYKDIPSLTYEGITDDGDNGTRVLNTTNSGCKVYGCSEMMQYVYNQCPGLVERITYKEGDVCPEQFPVVYDQQNRTLTAALEGALPADVSADYEVKDIPLATDYIVCHKFEIPDPLAMAVKMTQKRLKCDLCIDILALVIVDYPTRLRNTQNNQIIALTVTGANFPQGSSDLYDVMANQVTELTTRKVNIGGIVTLMSTAAFNTMRGTRATDKKFIFDYAGKCPEQYCEVCINGYRILVTDAIPTAGVAGARTSQIISADLNMIVGRGTKMQKCEYNESQSCLGNKVIEAFSDFQVAVPVNMAGKFIFTNVIF